MVAAPVLDVALTPDGLARADLAVVIDVLRATTTVTWGLGAGYERVLCAGSVWGARALAGPDRVLAGERDCVAPPGFDHGNSPREAAAVGGRELILASTNGTPAIVAATGFAPVVLVGALANLEALVGAIAPTARGGTVQLVCAGTEGSVALEDVYLAGRLSRRVGGERSDAARTAEALARRFPDPLAALRSSAHADRLRVAGLAGDLADCALESVLDTVGHVATVGPGVAALTAGVPCAHAPHRCEPSGAESGAQGSAWLAARAAAAEILAGGSWCVLEACRDVPAQRWDAQLVIFDLHPAAVADVVCEELAARPDHDLRLTACDRGRLAPEPGLGTRLVYVAASAEPTLDVV